MDIKITKLVVPAKSRNGRIYNNIGTSVATGAPVSGGGTPSAPELWKKVGEALSPTTEGDRVEVTVTGIDTTAIAGHSEFTGVAGVGSNYGVYGTGIGAGVYGESEEGIGVLAFSEKRVGLSAQGKDCDIETLTPDIVSIKSAGRVSGQEAIADNEFVTKSQIKSTIKVIFKQTADKSITNTTTETSIFGTGVGSRTLPATLATGNYIRINLQGYISTPSSKEGFTLRVKYGATTLITLTENLFSSMTDAVFDLKLNIAVRSAGVSGRMRPAGSVLIEIRSLGYTNMIRLQTTSDVAVDTTSAKDIDITAQWTNAIAANSLITHVSTIEIL